jgi:hypothetical protein
MVQRDARILRVGQDAAAIRRPVTALAALMLLIAGRAMPVSAQDAAEPLIHMGVICLQEEPLATQFAERLAAKGKPVFYIGDLAKGISQGDMIRFADKAVLIEADIWQTMKNIGILEKLKNIPVTTLTAKARTDVWESRSSRVSGSNENKGYTLGRELLKIFADYFGKTPSRLEMVVRFNGGYMTLVAPDQLLNELNFVKVIRLQKTQGTLQFITPEPPRRLLVTQPVYWTVWAIDPQEPSGQLQYTCASRLPDGCTWDGAKHTLSGTLTEPDSVPLAFTVRNSDGKTASLACTLIVHANTPPRVQARYDEIILAGSRWEYAPFIADGEHTLDEIEIKLPAWRSTNSAALSSGMYRPPSAIRSSLSR